MVFLIKKRTGFTLVELLIVLAIMAILIGVSAPKLTALFPNSLEKTATRLRGAMMKARWMAARDCRDVYLSFDIRQQKIMILRRKKGVGWKHLGEIILPADVRMEGLWRASGKTDKKEILRFAPDGGGEGFGLFLLVGQKRLTAIGYPFRQGVELVPGWIQEKEIE